MSVPSARERYDVLLGQATRADSLVKLTLGRPTPEAGDLRNLFARPVTLKRGPHLSLVWRHATRDITKNLPIEEGLAALAQALGTQFHDAHLFTRTQAIELRCHPGGQDQITVKAAAPTAPKPQTTHDREKAREITAGARWLHLLGVTNERGAPRAEMSAKFRQIQKFAELLRHLLEDAALIAGTIPAITPEALASAAAATLPASDAAQSPNAAAPLSIVDMGCGKGYLTFAVADQLGALAQVTGVELRPELVARCNGIARDCDVANLHFVAGTIQAADLGKPDVVIALHACDTATDDALSRGIAAGARVLLVSPCCQKELRSQLRAPEVLAGALRHGILQERQSEFVTDALRAELLEWAGYRTRVFEFISTEHTARNLMISAVRVRPPGDAQAAARVRALAAFYGITHHALARHLNFALTQA